MLVCVSGSGNELEGGVRVCHFKQFLCCYWNLMSQLHFQHSFFQCFIFYLHQWNSRCQELPAYISLFFFSMRCNMSMDNLKESAALSSSGTAKVETHRAVTQCWGQRLALAFLNLALKHRSLDVLRADDPNSWEMCGFIQSLGMCTFVEYVCLIH